MHKGILLVVGFVFIDVLGFSLILPLLPYLAQSYDASATLVGTLLTSNALAQLVCAPFLGRLSDVYGRKVILLICIAGTCVSFLLMGAASSLSLLFVSRILDGVLGGNISLAYAYIADVTSVAERTQSHGLIGAAFGIAFVIGPACGGALVRHGYHIAAYCAAALSAVNFVAVALWLPESLRSERRSTGSIWAFWDLTGGAFTRGRQPLEDRRRLRVLLAVRLCFALVFSCWEAVFGLVSRHLRELDARSSSYAMAGVAFIYALVQGGLMRPLSRRCSDAALATVGLVGVAVGMALWVTSAPMWVGMAIFGVAAGIANTALSSAVSKEVPPDRQGGAMSVAMSLSALSRVVAPAAGGLLIDYIGPHAPGLACAALASAGAVACRLLLRQDRPKAQ